LNDEPVINLDKLTYAGNPETLQSLQGDTRHTLVQGDIGDRALVSRYWLSTNPAPSSTLPPRAMSTAASTAPVTSSTPTSLALMSFWRPYANTGLPWQLQKKQRSASCM
jgi:hypothetical protein